MFEHFKDPLLPLPIFFTRVMQHILLGIIMIFLALFMGMAGYHHYEHMSWVDSFVNAAMILSGMGRIRDTCNNGWKNICRILCII